MDKESLGYTNWKYYLAIRKNEILWSAATWMELEEDILLNVIIQEQKDKYPLFLLKYRVEQLILKK